MALITRFLSRQEAKQIYLEQLINNTDSVNKVAPESVLNGIGFGIGKISQLAMKEFAIVESYLIPDSASGDNLNATTGLYGVPGRFTASGSSTFIRIQASPGTTYPAASTVFTTRSGLVFTLVEDAVVGDLSFGYFEVRSSDTGARTNVEPGDIISVSPIPSGHLYVINEYMAIGGRDNEDDVLLRQRIKEGANIGARGTLANLTQVFQKINNNIIDVFYVGSDNNTGRSVLSVSTQNGVGLTDDELDQILSRSTEFLGINELRLVENQQSGIILRNAERFFVDVDFRVRLDSSFDMDRIRQEIQIGMTKILDFRNWVWPTTVQWTDLLEVAKNVRGVEFVPDNFFFPQQNFTPDFGALPRIRGFIMRDLDGNILSNSNGTITPVYYPTSPDPIFQSTAISSI